MKHAFAVMLSGAVASCSGQAARAPAGSPLSDAAGAIPPETIQRIVRARFSVFRRCYEAGLFTNPELAGRVVVKFVIDGNGEVHDAVDAGSTVTDPSVVECVVSHFHDLSFPHPQPGGGHVTVVYPIEFKPEPRLGGR